MAAGPRHAIHRERGRHSASTDSRPASSGGRRAARVAARRDNRALHGGEIEMTTRLVRGVSRGRGGSGVRRVGAVRAAGRLVQRVRALGEEGMTTAEYAVGTVAAVAFAGLLLTIVRSGPVKSALSGIIVGALGSGS